MLTMCKVRASKVKVKYRHFQIKRLLGTNERRKFSPRCLPTDKTIKVTK